MREMKEHREKEDLRATIKIVDPDGNLPTYWFYEGKGPKDIGVKKMRSGTGSGSVTEHDHGNQTSHESMTVDEKIYYEECKGTYFSQRQEDVRSWMVFIQDKVSKPLICIATNTGT